MVDKQKLSFAAKLRDSKMRNWKWNPLAIMLADPNRSGADGI